jgi:CheY-like chemotaxis protein
MPGGGTLDAARRIRDLGEECGDAVLIASTGFDDEGLRGQAAEAGVDHYFVKPFVFDSLDNILRLYLPKRWVK